MTEEDQIAVFTTCVECRSGKHQNCDGIADLDINDDPVPCFCEQDEHPLR